MKRAPLIALLLALLLAAFLFSLAAGKLWLAPWGLASGSPEALVMAQLRLPRALLGLGLGATLGATGAVLQGYLRNPLADPGILGVSATAALGSVAAMLFGFAATPVLVAACGMAGALLAMGVLALLAGRSSSTTRFVLAGVLLSSLAGAITALLISLAPNPYALEEMVVWLMGALTDRGMDDVLLTLPAMALSLGLLALTARSLDALALGEATARSLGVHPGRLQWLVIAGAGIGVGAGVAVTGVVGFVGLIVPHLVRPLAGERPSLLVLPSALAGAALVLLADGLVRLVPGPGELKLGVAMALLGAPFFGLLLCRTSGHRP